MAAVSLPPLPGRPPAPRPGTALRTVRPPTPPPRPESSLLAPPPPHTILGDPPPPLLHLPPSLAALDSPITLTTPRTVSARTQNLYVDTPFQGGALPTTAPAPRPCGAALPSAVKRSSRTVIKTQSVSQLATNSPVITSAPSPCSPPDKPSPPSQPSPPSPTSPTESIICVRCGKCRCAACATPRALPSAWLCDNSCLCSAEAALDTVSCMCCVKAAFYHCGERLDQDSDKEEEWVDSPCSCTSNKWWLRWGCLGVMSTCLPCLLCYPLLRALSRGAESCYQAATTRGCTCPEPPTDCTSTPASSPLNSPTDSQKRLLG